MPQRGDLTNAHIILLLGRGMSGGSLVRVKAQSQAQVRNADLLGIGRPVQRHPWVKVASYDTAYLYTYSRTVRVVSSMMEATDYLNITEVHRI